MDYAAARKFISTRHIYEGVTALEAVNCPMNKALTEVAGVTLLGTETPYEAIAAKEIVRPEGYVDEV